MSKDDGGPAFPVTRDEWNDYEKRHEDVKRGGMRLRDWFAGQALPGYIANMSNAPDDYVAKQCYGLADAMLAEREVGKEQK